MDQTYLFWKIIHLPVGMMDQMIELQNIPLIFLKE